MKYSGLSTWRINSLRQNDAYIYVSEKYTIFGSDNGLSPGRHQAIIWTNAGILLSGPLGTNFSKILIEIYTFSFKKMHFKTLSGRWRPFSLGLNVLTHPKHDLVCIWTCIKQYKTQMQGSILLSPAFVIRLLHCPIILICVFCISYQVAGLICCIMIRRLFTF